MWLPKRLLVLVVSIASILATADVSTENIETEGLSDLLPEDIDQVVEGSATQSVESMDVPRPSESNLIDVDEPAVDRSSGELPLVRDSQPDHVQETVTESLTKSEGSQEQDISLVKEDVVSNEEISAPKENGIEAAAQEIDLNADHIKVDEVDTDAGDNVPETQGPNSEIVEEGEAQNNVDAVNVDDIDHTLETVEKSSDLQKKEVGPAVERHSTEHELHEDSEQLQGDIARDELSVDDSEQTENISQGETVNDTVSDSSGDEETRPFEESNQSPVHTGERTEAPESELRYQPNCGVWGVYQPDSRYANISILALLFQDLFQKDEAEAAAILKDLAASVTMPMQDVLDRIHNVTEEISEMVDSADRIKRSPNSEFVEGLDDIDKFFEGVDVPDELDVGAVGSSIQEVLMGQGTQIVIKRLKMGFVAIQDGIMTIKVSAVASIEDIISRREEFATKKDEFLLRLQNGKTALVKSAVEFRDGDNERRKELLRHLARLSWRTTIKTTSALKEFVERLFEDGEDIQDILKGSSAVDDEIQQMIRKIV